MANNDDHMCLQSKVDMLEVKLLHVHEEKSNLKIAIDVLTRRSVEQRTELSAKLRAVEADLRNLGRRMSHQPLPTSVEVHVPTVEADLLLDLDVQADVPELVADEAASVASDHEQEPTTPSHALTPLSSFIANSQRRSFPSFKSPGDASKEDRDVPSEWTLQQRAISYDVDDMSRNKDFFRFGIRFTPSATLPNTRQRVVLTNLPTNATVASVLSIVRGGSIVSCEILSTIPITGFLSALIRFQTEAAVLAYDDFLAKHKIELDGHRLGCYVLPTDSFPLSSPELMAIKMHGQTRCLEVENFPWAEVRPELLMYNLRPFQKSEFCALEKHIKRTDGVLVLLFSSVFYAGQAFGILTTWRRYKKCVVKFAKDPCAGPLEDLLIRKTIEAQVQDVSAEQTKTEDNGLNSLREKSYSAFTSPPTIAASFANAEELQVLADAARAESTSTSEPLCPTHSEMGINTDLVIRARFGESGARTMAASRWPQAVIETKDGPDGEPVEVVDEDEVNLNDIIRGM